MTELKPLVVKDYINRTDIRTMEDVENILLPWLRLNNEFGWDVETVVTKTFFDRKIRTCQFGNKKNQYFIDLLDFVDGDAVLLEECQGWFGNNLYAAPKLRSLLKKLEPFLCSGSFLKVGVNLGFEFTVFYWNFGMATWGFYGCDMVERVIIAGLHPLEDFSYFSMEEMMQRYYGVQIDKTLQTSFTIDQPLSEDQKDYAVLDTRLPLAIRYRQLHGYARENGTHVPGILEDGLERVCKIENNAIMPFEMMHVHGEKIDTVAWTKRTDEKVAERVLALEKLDQAFIPLVGSKKNFISQEEVDTANAVWKAIKDTKDEARAVLKKKAGDLSKLRTVQSKAIANAQGEALVNYGSPSQILKILRTVPGLKKLKSTEDGDLKPYEGMPIIDALRNYRELDKQISTYGYAWAKQWTSSPSNEEGWLSPFTGKLHARFNQLMAETGRGSSDNPNGQNLPRDKKVRAMFMAEEGYFYITADMSGAELRIIAELAKSKTWIEAFARGEDLHSVGCEILFPKEWPADQCKGEDIFDDKGKIKYANYYCEYYALNAKGEPTHAKCNCPKHGARREVTKAINFLLAYGGIAMTLAARIGVSTEDAEILMQTHEEKFPEVHEYLEKSGKNAIRFFKSFDMFGRRRSFPVPNAERGRAKIIKYWKESIKLSPELADKNIQAWMEENQEIVLDKKGNQKIKQKKPTGDVKFWLTHREPNPREIQKAINSILNGIERQGKNHSIQGTNASIIKMAMGAGFSPKGMPYLFHTLPLLGAKLVKMVHDELVVTVPKENAERVAKLIGIAIKTAAAEVMSEVVMEFEYAIAPYWKK